MAVTSAESVKQIGLVNERDLRSRTVRGLAACLAVASTIWWWELLFQDRPNLVYLAVSMAAGLLSWTGFALGGRHPLPVGIGLALAAAWGLPVVAGEAGWMAQLISRAIDSSVYVVPVTFGIGVDEPWMPGTIMGRSGVVGQDGETLVSAGRLPGVASAVVDLDQRRLVRCFGVLGLSDYRYHAMSRRRPDTYEALTRPAVGVDEDSSNAQRDCGGRT